MRWLVLAFALASAVNASPLSTLECGCPSACNVTTLSPRCDASFAATARGRANDTDVVEWMGMVTSPTPGVGISSTSVINCSRSFQHVFASNGTLVFASHLVQVTSTVCTASAVSLAGKLFIGLRGLGSVGITLLPFTSAPYYRFSGLALSSDGQHAVLATTVNFDSKGCCALPASIDFVSKGCVGTGTLSGTHYTLSTIDTACAESSVDVGGNTVATFIVNVTSLPCPGSPLFTENVIQVVQVTPSPTIFTVSINTVGYTAAGCPLTEVGFVKPYALVIASSQWIDSFTSCTLSQAAFSGVPATVGAPVISARTDYAWVVTGQTCIPTTYCDDDVPVVGASAAAVFDALTHTAVAVERTMNRACSFDTPVKPCVLNGTAAPELSLHFTSPYFYVPSDPVIVRFESASAGYLVTTVVASWMGGVKRRAFTRSIDASLFSASGFSFVPASHGFPALDGAGNWDFTVFTQSTLSNRTGCSETTLSRVVYSKLPDLPLDYVHYLTLVVVAPVLSAVFVTAVAITVANHQNTLNKRLRVKREVAVSVPGGQDR